MNKDNSKVPIAILSCFLIAFIIQGVLKISGIFIFEKALDWEIFKIIDNNAILECIYYSLITFINIYCLSFALTSKPYSNKWYHYIILLIVSFGSTTIKNLITFTNQIYIIFDVFVYIVVPFIINLTTLKENKILKNDIFGIIITLALNIMMYFCYIGLVYWSNLLTSLLPISPFFISSSTFFLIRLEVYIGLIAFMISMNIVIKEIIEMKKIIRNINLPVDIASDEAKIEELENLKNKGN